MKVISSKTDAKKRRRDDSQDAISESPKRAKVHAQRKFAQGAAYNAPAITIIKDKVRPPTNISAPGLMLSSKRPNTEDFLTFLCFRRTKILPAKLDFFKDAFKHQPVQSTYTQKTSNAMSVYKNHAAKSLINKQNTKKNERSECVKKAQTPVQALRRKYQEQRLAKQNPTNVTKLAQKVKGKNMMRTRSSTLQEEITKPVKKIVLLKERKAPLSGLRSGLQRSPPEAPKNVKKPEKFIDGKNLRSRFKGTIISKKSGIKEPPLKKPSTKNFQHEESGKKIEQSKNVKNSETWTRTRGARANIKKVEGFSDFSSDENEPLLAVRKGKPGLRTRQTANEVKKETKTNTMKTRSQITEVAQANVRPTRKTKEAAAIYMEMITKKLVSPEKSGDDDRSSVDSFPELPSARRNEQRESEMKAKAMAVRKSLANESKSNFISEDREKGGKLSNSNSRRRDAGKRNDVSSRKVGTVKNFAKENQLTKTAKELPKRIIRDLSKRSVKNLPPKKIVKETVLKKITKVEPLKKLLKEESRGKSAKEEETKKVARDEHVKKPAKEEQVKKDEGAKKTQDGATKKISKEETLKKVVNDDNVKKSAKEVPKRNLKEESPKKCLRTETIKRGSQNEMPKKISKEDVPKKSLQEDLVKKNVKDESSKKPTELESSGEKTVQNSSEEKFRQPEDDVEVGQNGEETEDRSTTPRQLGKKQEEPEIKQEKMAEKANGVKKSNSFSKKGCTGGQTVSCTSSSPQEKMVSSLVEAPTFYPTEKEFQDPLEFFERIRPAAENFGLCRIVPPSTFKPDCKVSDDMRFTAYNQYVHRMFHRWGPNIKEMMAIKKYLATQSISLKQPPWIGSIEVDLPRLYQCVQNCGGLMKVMEKKKWHQVADMMRIPKAAQDRVTKLDDIYCKYLLPYDTLSHDERQKLFDEVENDWLKRQESTADSTDEDSEEEFYIDECEECIVKGRNMALNQFYRIARNTMSMWFKTQEPTPSEVENEFWRHVSERTNHVCVHSGSIDSSGWGYGFPVAKNNSFSKHPWNLKVLTNNSGSILRSLGPVMGVTVPTLHVGMVFTAFCWYRDPHGLPWVEYLHTGAPKIWYGISDDNSSVFKEALTKLLPRYIKNKKIWLPSDTAMVPPALLADHGVSLCHTIQKPGQFILVFPRAFTSSICTGYLVSESVYFARPSWLTTAEQVFRDIRDCCEPTMFSLEKLLFSIATDTRSSVEVLKQVLPMVCHIKESEIEARKILWEMGLKTWERLPVKDQSNNKKKGRRTQDEEGDYECIVCSMNLCVSLVMNSQEEGVMCLRHAIDLLTQKRSHLKYCRLMFGYTQEELCELVEKLEQKIESKSQKRVQSRPSAANGK